jgi:hypothetical protein
MKWNSVTRASPCNRRLWLWQDFFTHMNPFPLGWQTKNPVDCIQIGEVICGGGWSKQAISWFYSISIPRPYEKNSPRHLSLLRTLQPSYLETTGYQLTMYYRIWNHAKLYCLTRKSCNIWPCCHCHSPSYAMKYPFDGGMLSWVTCVPRTLPLLVIYLFAIWDV